MAFKSIDYNSRIPNYDLELAWYNKPLEEQDGIKNKGAELQGLIAGGDVDAVGRFLVSNAAQATDIINYGSHGTPGEVLSDMLTTYSDKPEKFNQLLDILARYKPEINAKNLGDPLLSTAVREHKSKKIIQALIEHGARIPVLDRSARIDLRTVLHNTSNPDVMRIILEKMGESPYVDDNSDFKVNFINFHTGKNSRWPHSNETTALHYIAGLLDWYTNDKKPKDDQEIEKLTKCAQLLIDHGADKTIQNQEGKTPDDIYPGIDDMEPPRGKRAKGAR